VWTVAFSADGKTLASGNGDWNRPGMILLWETSTWKKRGALKHSNEVLCLSFSGEGRLTAGAWDGQIRGWDDVGKESCRIFRRRPAQLREQLAELRRSEVRVQPARVRQHPDDRIIDPLFLPP